MSISEKTRREVMERDEGRCQFWHSSPYPADQISHFDHQGIGGLPPDHWKNLPPNLAASCGECHARFHQGRRYKWEEFKPPSTMTIHAPNGKLVPRLDLWFYVRWEWQVAEVRYREIVSMIQQERFAAWEVAKHLAWFKDKGVAPAVGSADYLDLGASLGLSSAEVKKRIRVNAFREGGADMSAVDIDVADRLRKIPETDLVEVAGWFASLPPAEAWARFNIRYPGPERQKKYRIFTGSYREVTAATDDAVEIQGGAVVVKGGSVIAGVRKEVDDASD